MSVSFSWKFTKVWNGNGSWKDTFFTMCNHLHKRCNHLPLWQCSYFSNKMNYTKVRKSRRFWKCDYANFRCHNLWKWKFSKKYETKTTGNWLPLSLIWLPLCWKWKKKQLFHDNAWMVLMHDDLETLEMKMYEIF